MCLTCAFLGPPVPFFLQGTNKNMSPITASKVDYHMTQLAPNKTPLTQLFSHI